MCGIAGFINLQDRNLAIEKLLQALHHRGPDKQSHYSHDALSLVHTRLAIQDIQHGHQPLHYQHYTIILNGQIYNHLALRKEYLRDFPFQTSSDTETLLAMYIQFDKDLFQYLDGMFAFAILDRNKNSLFLARDRAGKKPLYYYKKNDRFAFASELNALKAILPLTLHHEAIKSLLRCGFFFKEHTPYHEVYELNAGHYLSLDLTSLALQKKSYFDLLEVYHQPKLELSLPDAMALTDQTLQTAVKNRLMSSELEVGAFLSGGIDSNLIVALAAQEQSRLKTFTVKFPGEYDETSLAKLTAARYRTEHTEIEIAMDVEQDLEKILLNYGEPFLDSSAIPSYYVAKEAKKHVTVVLNGDGADELFAGYRRYVPLTKRWIEWARTFAFLTAILPKPHHKKSKYNYFYRLLAMSSKQGLDFYTSATVDAFNDSYTFPLNAIDDQLDGFIHQVQGDPHLSALDKMLYLDFNLLLFGDLLVKMDIATMAHALEARSPFLSRDMLRLSAQLPDHYKIKGTATKFILRQLAKQYLPLELINQPKRGFEIPLKSWLNHELKTKMHAYLEGTPKVSDYVAPSFIQNLLQRKVPISDEKRAKMLWSLLATEIWLQHN